MRQRLHPLTLALAIGCAMSLIAQAQTPAQSSAGQNPLPGTRLGLDELRQQMFHVCAGRSARKGIDLSAKNRPRAD